MVGWTNPKAPGRRTGFIPPDIRVENAVAVVAKDGMVLARLYDEAQLWVEAEVQAVEDREIERKQYRELRAAEGPKQEVKGLSKFTDGSKTERETDKRARHEQNVVNRRAADQELRTKMRGK